MCRKLKCVCHIKFEINFLQVTVKEIIQDSSKKCTPKVDPTIKINLKEKNAENNFI